VLPIVVPALVVLCQLPHRLQGSPVGQVFLSKMLDTFLCYHLRDHVSKDVLIHVNESSLCQLCGPEVRFATVWLIHCFVEVSQAHVPWPQVVPSGCIWFLNAVWHSLIYMFIMCSSLFYTDWVVMHSCINVVSFLGYVCLLL